MISQQQRAIAADQAPIRRLLTEGRNWPALFPHIRQVDHIWHETGLDVYQIAATWHHLPIHWRMQQTQSGEITQTVLGGIANGTQVVWRLSQVGDTTTVTATIQPGKRLLQRCIDELVRQTLDMVQMLGQADQRSRLLGAA